MLPVTRALPVAAGGRLLGRLKALQVWQLGQYAVIDPNFGASRGQARHMAMRMGILSVFETARTIQDPEPLAREVNEPALCSVPTIAPTELHGILRRRPS